MNIVIDIVIDIVIVTVIASFNSDLLHFHLKICSTNAN